MENMVLNLSLTVTQINVILKYLGAGSFVEVEPVITAIRDQAAPQIASIQQPLAEVEEKSE